MLSNISKKRKSNTIFLLNDCHLVHIPRLKLFIPVRDYINFVVIYLVALCFPFIVSSYPWISDPTLRIFIRIFTLSSNFTLRDYTTPTSRLISAGFRFHKNLQHANIIMWILNIIRYETLDTKSFYFDFADSDNMISPQFYSLLLIRKKIQFYLLTF